MGKFKDSKGTRGQVYRQISYKKISGKIRFELFSATHLRLMLPDGKFRLVHKKNCISLAHWLLDKCTDISYGGITSGPA